MFKRIPHLMDEAGAGGVGGAAAAPVAAPAPVAPAPAGAAALLSPPAPAPAAPAAPAPAPAAWHESFTDPALKEWVAATGLDGPERAAAKAWNLEKLLGADRAGRTVTIPPDINDAKAMEAVYTKLGRPETIDGYKLTIPDGADPSFGKTAAEWFHGAGLNPAQAQVLNAKWNDYQASQMQAMQQQEQETLKTEHEALAAEWGTGPAADAKREAARRAAVSLGLDETAITALEKVSGFAKTLKALAKVGEMSGEAPAVGLGESGGKFAMTPGEARARAAQLKADPEWVKRYLNGDNQARGEMAKLDQVLASVMSSAM